MPRRSRSIPRLSCRFRTANAAVEGGDVGQSRMLHPDPSSTPDCQRQRAPDCHTATRTGVVKETHAHGDGSDPPPLEQVAQLLHASA
jgi:hypothetical protein